MTLPLVENKTCHYKELYLQNTSNRQIIVFPRRHLDVLVPQQRQRAVQAYSPNLSGCTKSHSRACWKPSRPLSVAVVPPANALSPAARLPMR
jgi:hypothetical protein